MADAAETAQIAGNGPGNGSGNGSGRHTSVSTIRIAIVVSHPIQYFTPLYRAAAAISGVDLKVFFCRNWGIDSYYDEAFQMEVKWDIPLLDGYPWEFLDAKKDRESPPFFRVDNPSVDRALEKYRPDVVMVHGYAHRTMWRSVRWCNKNRVPVMIVSDSNGSAERTFWKRVTKSLVLGHFYRGLDGAFSTGENNRKYHRQYGLPDNRLFNGTMPIDCAQLARSAGDPAKSRREIRKKHGVPEDAFVVVFAGKLIPLKCTLDLLKAVHLCSESNPETWCILVGEGPERPILEEFIRDRQMRNVVLTGFVNQSEIGKYYAASDAVALMSWREAKGAPVAEAGIFGCPAILCDRVGCIGPADSARPNENALIYPWGDVNALANCIKRLCQEKSLYSSMSEAARRIAQLQDASVAAAQLQQAAIGLRKLGSRRSGNSTN